MMKIAKSLLLTSAFVLSVLGMSVALSGKNPVHAASLSMTLACVDNSTGIKVATNKTKHTATVTCKSGSKIDYLLNGDVQPTNLIVAACKPAGEKPGSRTKGNTAQDPTVTYLQFYCVAGGGTADAPTKITKTTPTVKDRPDLLASANDSGGPTGDGITNQSDPAATTVACTKSNCPLISKYVNPAIAVLSALVGIVAVIAIIVGGIQVTTSAGDPQKSAAGKNHIRNAVIGVVAYLFLYAFLKWLTPGGGQ